MRAPEHADLGDHDTLGCRTCMRTVAEFAEEALGQIEALADPDRKPWHVCMPGKCCLDEVVEIIENREDSSDE